MPLIIEGGRVPPRWFMEADSRKPTGSACPGQTEHLNIAFLNNMPDAALEDTELQFFGLLDDASGDVPVYLNLYSLTGIPRTERAQRHLSSFYFGLDELWRNRFDGVIVTGTEPRQPDLRDEPYWRGLADVFEWAESNTSSAVLSCLAAHASVLHSDGIGRHRLPDKQFGVFGSTKTCEHTLLSNISDGVRFPHSRWNEVREGELTAAGYVVLMRSEAAGVDTFVKKKKNSLFVHFQGHPEYGVETIFKEYRRDIKRFLNHERETYPTLPQGYFEDPVASALGEFQKHAMSDRREEVMSAFPEAMAVACIQNGWHAGATGIYRNWLRYLLASELRTSAFTAATSSLGSPPIPRRQGKSPGSCFRPD